MLVTSSIVASRASPRSVRGLVLDAEQCFSHLDGAKPKVFLETCRTRQPLARNPEAGRKIVANDALDRFFVH
jgi:hypothetical protein